MLRPALALALVLAATTAVAAQDLSGRWVARGPGDVRAVTLERRGGGYAAAIEGTGETVHGTAAFDGTALSIAAERGPKSSGLAKGVEPGAAKQAGPGAALWLGPLAFEPGSDVDALTGRGGRFTRLSGGATRVSGSRAQLEAATRALADARGNKDGIAGNEGGAAGRTPSGWFSFVNRQPLLDKLDAFLGAGWSKKDERAALEAFLHERERAWGRRVSDLPVAALADGGLFRATKAIALTRFDRAPDEVTEGFVDARGSVDGQPIAARRVFWQRWAPRAAASGKVVVISPGFQETGRCFLEQADLLARAGHDVILMDHQWAGYTTGGKQGGLDRGFGVARDVAAVAAFAADLAAREHKEPGAGVVLVGNSMGAGPGVLGAIVLNDAGRLELSGKPMPRGLPAVLQAPFLAMSPGWINGGLAVASHIPGFNRIPFPSLGAPVLTHDPAAAGKFAEHAASEDLRARVGAMTAAEKDIARVLALVGPAAPAGRVYVIHGDRDPLADPAASKALVEKLGARGKLELIASRNHVLEEEPGAQRLVVGAVAWASGR